MKEIILFTPPAAFLVIFIAMLFLAYLFSKCAFRSRNKADGGKKPYACGEDFTGNMIQPDYSQFFPFAFFFTILHVVTLVVATVPAETMGIFTVALFYVTGAGVGLLILLRR